MVTRVVYKTNVKERKEKYISTSLHPSKVYTLPLTKMPYANSPPKYKTTFIQNYSPFLSRMTKGKSLRGRHLVIIGRASSLMLMITSIVILISWNLRRRRWKGSEITKASLSMSDMTDLGVYLTHLIGEIVKMTTKVSLHLLKLRHDGL